MHQDSIMSLENKWIALKEEKPGIRIRNAAAELDVSEAELLLTKLGREVTRLNSDFIAILSDLGQLGRVMALTRNDACVHERKGIYLHPDFSSPHAALFLGEDIDLRIFLSQWAYAFSVVEETQRDVQRSLQFFGHDGMAIHKVYLTPESNIKSFEDLIKRYKSEEQSRVLALRKIQPKPAEIPDAEIDIAGFQEAWKSLKDTHDFFIFMKRFGLSRLQALRLAPDDFYAKNIKNKSIVKILKKAAERALPIMVFTGNRGNIQIHTGAIQNTLWHQSWFNVMDPDFNLHLNMDSVSESWVVRKPTDEGVVTAIEVFDINGEMIVQFFGKRKPGIPELKEWRELVAEIESI